MNLIVNDSNQSSFTIISLIPVSKYLKAFQLLLPSIVGSSPTQSEQVFIAVTYFRCCHERGHRNLDSFRAESSCSRMADLKKISE